MRFQRAVRRNQARQREDRTERVRHAEEYVFRALERQWSDALGGGRIPKPQRKLMRADPGFRMLVARRLAGEPLVFPDRDHVPDREVREDGTLIDRRAEQIGPAIRRPRCPECRSEPVDKPGEPCEDCRKLYHDH